MIVVTGLMRSGTTPLAKMLHQMGVPMGEHMRFPAMGPLSHPEWEDEPLSSSLAKRLTGQMKPESIRGIFKQYISGRVAVHGALWGVKSPFLLPYMDQWRTAADEVGSGEVIVITTERPYADTVKSLEAQSDYMLDPDRTEFMEFLMSLQERLATARDELKANCTIDIGDTWAWPRSVAARLASVAGISVDLDAATRGIGRGER
jgi:hypothetical protein